MAEEMRLAADPIIAIKPAVRATLSSPGRARKVTEALKIIAAFTKNSQLENCDLIRWGRTTRQTLAPIISMGPDLISPLSSS